MSDQLQHAALRLVQAVEGENELGIQCIACGGGVGGNEPEDHAADCPLVATREELARSGALDHSADPVGRQA